MRPCTHPSLANSTQDLQTFLKGHWSLERTLRDFRLNEQGWSTGQALFTQNKATLLYHEKTQCQFGRYTGLTQQSYHFTFLTPTCAHFPIQNVPVAKL